MSPRDVLLSEPWTYRDISPNNHQHSTNIGLIPDTPDLNKKLPPMPRPSMDEAEPERAIYGTENGRLEQYASMNVWTEMEMDHGIEATDIGEYCTLIFLTC